MNIFNQIKPIDFVAKETGLRNWRFFGDEMEVLGARLDAARKSLAGAKTEWARWYWGEAVDRLMLQWKSLPILHDAEAQMTIIPRWTIDYEYYERGHELNYGIEDKLFDKIFRVSLDESWNRIRDERIRKCSC
jgi:hypothetical protein